MITSNDSHLSLNNLQDGSPRTLLEALQAAKRLISNRTGIISAVEFEDLAPGEPSVYFATSTPANTSALSGMETMNNGAAASVDPKRAFIKAVGESVERYCPAHFKYENFTLATYNDLNCEAVHPADFALFSEKQYADPEFYFSRPTESTPMRWVSAYSISQDQPVMIPASFVYIPYYFDRSLEPLTHNPISTGLACGSNLAPAIYKGILEAIERDAFMIMWQNQLPCRKLDLSTITNSFIQSLLNELKVLPVECQAYLIPSDIGVPVILVLLRSTSGHLPHTVMGISVDLDPQKALMLALEEVSLSWIGMGRYALAEKDFKPAKDYSDITTLTLHGLVHAVDPALGKSLEFLNDSEDLLSIQDIQNSYDDSMLNNIQTLVERLKQKDLNVIVKDLTTVDVNEAGFKVIRVVVPGMQPLDVSHARRHLGGKRIYEVPCQMGLRQQPITEENVNPYPHMFP